MAGSVLSLLLTAALAQDAPVGDSVEDSVEEPAREEVQAEPVAPATVQGPRARPLAIPSGAAADEIRRMDEERSRAIRAYRMQYLRLGSWNEVRTSGMYTDVGFGTYSPYGYGGVTVMTPYVWTQERWSVYRGPQRLNNLQYLERIGANAEAADLGARVRKNRTLGSVFYGVAIAGGVATVSSVVAMDNLPPNDLQSLLTWRSVGIAGLGGVFGGVLVASFPSARARRLVSDPTAIRDWETLQNELLDHNDVLRESLGLSPDDALKAEQGS